MADNPFEMPQPMRERAEEEQRHAHAAYDHLTAYMNNAAGAWMGAVPPNPLTTGTPLKTADIFAQLQAAQRSRGAPNVCG